MKFHFLLTSTFITSVALLAPVSSVRAQTSAKPPTDPHSVEAVAPPAVDPPSLSLKINGGTMASVVEELQRDIEAARKPPINVVFGPGLQDIMVPTLTLRKVSGTDALNLIAASSGCHLETIRGERGDVIGYQVSTNSIPSPDAGMSTLAGPGLAANPAPNTSPLGAQPKTQALPGWIAPSPQNSFIPPDLTQSTTPALQPMQPGFNSIVGFTSPVQPGPNVRVYPLGEITTLVKFSDVEKSLQEVLKAGGVSAESGKLALHEKTNVLVATGEPRVHELVSQLLEALQKNTASAASQNSREDNVKRQSFEYKMRLEAQEMDRARLQERLKESEVELTKLQRELDRARATVSPKPQ